MSGQPSGLALFAILFLGVLCVLGFMWLVSRVARWTRGEAPLLPEWVSRVSVDVRPPGEKLPEWFGKQTTQTNRQTTHSPAISRETRRLALDKTRAAVLEELLTCGWTITDLRRENILRGDSTTIGHEVAEVRKRLGLSDPDRTLKIRDEKGERVIPV